MARRKRRELEEEHENHERWMVTYADMVTLLMVLFIVMFAMSQVDEEKYDALKQGLAAGFGQSATVMDGSRALLDNKGSAPVTPLPNEDDPDLTAEQRQAVEAAVTRKEQLRQQRAYGDVQAEVDRLLEIRRRLERAIRGAGLERDVVTTIDNRGLVVSLVSRHVVFEANRAELTPRGTKVVNTLSKVLRRIPDPLQVDGHTNQVPVKPKYYATDWDLSAARAITVLRHLDETQGIEGSRLTASAFGHEKPLVDPDKPGSQRINKRVDIVVLSSLPAESRELLEQAAKQRGGRT
ncbi:OmpA/MotB family protein [Nocardioides daphniae]|uniref:Chemotaxis protein MotA n=1 Tax=Nocardioides daphniae TaxID=402297 RepID=A0A4P7UFW8_9ACTN|nr:flagellar motor protein MotB [Nocardioides daphniae]QCC78168.1 flagellar motor protein MotB [Nocardioides daphniae]GGD21333.1 chemotaxis protein MotA [Nocardioides daphniae]